MSFSCRVKEEICEGKVFRHRNRKAFARGFFLFGRSFSVEQMEILTGQPIVLRLFCRLVADYGEGTASAQQIGRRSAVYYRAWVEDGDCRKRLAAIFTPPEARFELLGGLTEQNDSAAFLSGAFLACGAVTTPASGYRLEFLPPSEALHDALFQLLTTLGYPPKTTVRRGAGVLYYKESVVIEDILTLIGASNCALEMMEVKIFKDLRNRANRAGNCDSANIDKTVKAAAEQLENIRQVYKALGEQNLPAELREIAGLRLENPEVSLRELGEMLTEPLSRSGVNHRLRRIARLAQKSKGAR